MEQHPEFQLAGEISKGETGLMMMETEPTEADIKTGTTNLLSSQTLLVMRLCESTFDQEMPFFRSTMVSQIGSMMQFKGIPTTVVHLRAMLRMYTENGHKFSPDQVLEDISVQGISLMAGTKVHQLNKIKMELKEEQVMRSRVRDKVEDIDEMNGPKIKEKLVQHE